MNHDLLYSTHLKYVTFQLEITGGNSGSDKLRFTHHDADNPPKLINFKEN